MCTDNQASLPCCSALFLYLQCLCSLGAANCAKAALISAVLCNYMYLFQYMKTVCCSCNAFQGSLAKLAGTFRRVGITQHDITVADSSGLDPDACVPTFPLRPSPPPPLPKTKMGKGWGKWGRLLCLLMQMATCPECAPVQYKQRISGKTLGAVLQVLERKGLHPVPSAFCLKDVFQVSHTAQQVL